jgi:hypothetical protein
MIERYNTELEESYPKHIVPAFFAVSYDDSLPFSEMTPPYPWPRDEEEIVGTLAEVP